MKTETAKRMIDAFRTAARMVDEMPPLEKGLTPACIRLIDVVHEIQAEGQPVHPSEISRRTKISRPAVARTLRQLSDAGAIIRRDSSDDGRTVEIVLSEKGEELYRRYVEEYYAGLSAKLKDIPEEDAQIMINTIMAIENASQKEEDNER